MSAAAMRAGGPAAWGLAAALAGAVLGVAAVVDLEVAAVAGIAVPVVVAVLLRPDWLPPVLLVTAFAESIAVGGVTISRLAAPLAVVLVLVRLGLEGLPSRIDGRVLRWVAGFVLLAVASILWSQDPQGVRAGGAGQRLGSLAIALVYLAAIVVLVRNEADVRRLLRAVWVVATIMGVIALEDYLGGGGRAAGYDGDPNYFAALQVFALPLGVLLAAHARGLATRLLYLAGVAIIAGSIVVSLSRGGLLAMLAVLMLLGIQPARAVFRTATRKRLAIAVLLVGGAALVTASYSDLAARSESLFSTSEGGSGRANLWRAAVTGWRQDPVIGIGFGAFRSQSNDLMLETPGVDFSAYKLRVGGQYAHSLYLGVLVELGLVGLAVLLGLLLAVALAYRRAAAAATAAGRPFLAGAARVLLVSFLGYGLASFFLSTETDRALWVLIGLAVVVPSIVARDEAGAAEASGSVRQLHG